MRTDGKPAIVGVIAAAGIMSLCLASQARGEDVPSYLDIVRRYADAMIERGRDTYGPVHSGLILSALDRMTLRPLTTRPAAPAGVRRADRSGPAWQPLTGANPHWAYTLGQFAVKNFWGDSPLPRASLKSDHYEAMTGADTLAVALEDLWVCTAHVNGVHVPANTIDR